MCGDASGKVSEEFEGNLADFGREVTAKSLYNILLPHLYAEQQEYSDKLQRMLDILDLSDGMQALAEQAYKGLQNPVFVIDGTNHFIAHAFEENSFAPEDAFGRFVSSNIHYGRVSEGGDRFYRRNKLDLLLMQTKGVVEQYDESLGCISLHRGLFLHNVCFGRVWMPCIEHEPTEMDHRIFEQFSRLAEQDIAKHHYKRDDHQEYEGFVLADLLSAPYVDPGLLRTAANMLHSKAGQCFYVISSETVSAEDSATMIFLRTQFKLFFPNQPVTILEDRIVSLFCLDAIDDIQKYRAALEDYSVYTGLHLGISNAWFQLDGSQAALQKAYHAVRLGKSIYPEERLHYYDDYSVYDLLLEYQKHHRLMGLLTPKMRIVRDFDIEKGTEYFQTLQAYFRFQGQKEKICEALHIHKNTLLYRLNRLRDYFGLMLDDGDEVMKYQLAIYIIRTLERDKDR